MGDTGVCQSRTMSRVTATQASWVKKWKKPRWCGKVPATRAGFIVCMKAFYIECFWMWIGYVWYCLAINSWSTWGGGCQSLSCEFSCYPCRVAKAHPPQAQHITLPSSLPPVPLIRRDFPFLLGLSSALTEQALFLSVSSVWASVYSIIRLWRGWSAEVGAGTCLQMPKVPGQFD